MIPTATTPKRQPPSSGARHDWMRVYLHAGSCGNTAAGLISNLQTRESHRSSCTLARTGPVGRLGQGDGAQDRRLSVPPPPCRW
jgi:hypothetical protein